MMKKVRFYLLVPGVMLMFMGCNYEAEGLLEQAEAYLPAEPDSAEMCLNNIKQPERLDDASRAWYGLLRTYADNRKGKEIKSDSLIRDSYEYYRDASHAGQASDQILLRRYAQSCYYMALFYSSCDSTKQCEDLLHQAIKYSEKCEDWHTCYLAYIILGNSTVWSNPEYAIQQSLKALDIYHKINDDVNNEVQILGKIAARFLSFAEPDSALKYLYIGERLAEKNHLVESQNEICMGIADTYLYMEKYETALSYAKRGIRTAEGEVLIPSLLSLAQCYQACDSLEKSQKILGTIRNSANPLYKYFIYRDLSRIAIRNQDFDSLYVYVDSAYESLEDRYLHSLSDKDEYYQDNLVKKLEKEKIQHEAERNKWVLGFIIFILILIVLYIYNVSRNRIVVERHKRLNHVLTQRLEHSKHLQEQQEKERVIAEHQKEIQHKQELLHQKSMTLAVLQKHLLEKLEPTCQLLSNSDNSRMTDEAWAEMERLLNETDNDFVKKLRKQRKDFKEEDIQLCMLVRMKMPNTIISKIYHIGVDAVKKRKLNLKKAGFKVTDSAISLEDVVDQL